mgnify:CR=1 FL=1
MGRKKKIKQQPIYYKRYLHNDGGDIWQSK